jgi:hypothetical protein
MLDAFKRALIEKAGKDNGWEHIKKSTSGYVDMSSAFHSAAVIVDDDKVPAGYIYRIRFNVVLPVSEVLRSAQNARFENDAWFVKDDDALSELLYRCAALIVSLPDTPLQNYEHDVQAALHADPVGISKTEQERLIRQRVGQQVYRKALLKYWQGACALTGVTVPEVLKASHAKPWTDCVTDAERLNVYNGFLFAANIDSLFDSGLITFTDEGGILISRFVSEEEYPLLGIKTSDRLRWIDEKHLPFLQWHRDKVFKE